MFKQCFICGKEYQDSCCVTKSSFNKLNAAKELIRKGIEPKHDVLKELKKHGYTRIQKND